MPVPDPRIASLAEQLIRRLVAIRTDMLRSKAAALELSKLAPAAAVELLGILLRLRRDRSSAAVAVDAISRALAKGELETEFVESIRESAQSKPDRLVEALVASGPAVREYDKNEETFVDRRLRTLTLGERRAMSRARDIDLLVRLAHDQDTRVVQGLLQNPRLTEREAVMIASRRPTHVNVLEAVLSSRFGASRRVRLAIAHNPYAPVALAARAMAALATPELEALATDDRIAEETRNHARSLLIGRRSTPAERARPVTDAQASDPSLDQWLADLAAERGVDLDEAATLEATRDGED